MFVFEFPVHPSGALLILGVQPEAQLGGEFLGRRQRRGSGSIAVHLGVCMPPVTFWKHPYQFCSIRRDCGAAGLHG